MILKYLFFVIHILFIIINFVIIYWQSAILNLIVMISWKVNDNKCILTQIEDYLFKQTLVEFISDRKISDDSKYVVPFYHRYSLYFIFFLNLIYYSIIGINFSPSANGG